jgi:phosphoserine aminotransferase
LDFSQFDLIYAGAQKNMGPAGATLVVVKRYSGKTGRDMPSYLNYQLHIDKESMYNTPPVFAVYTSTLQYLEQHGGIEAAEIRNEAKAKLLYDEIDRNPLFEGYSVKEDRSLMNVSFKLTDESKKKLSILHGKQQALVALMGTEVLADTAQVFNALPIESVQVLVDVMLIS